MASATTNIHLSDDDRPMAWRIETTGTACLWVDGPAGLNLIGSDLALSKVRDAIDEFLAQPKAEAA
jgi:hypothetical protein